MLTAEQCRAARAFLDWSITDLAEESGVNKQTISRFENNEAETKAVIVDKLQTVFENAGIEFLPSGGIQPIQGPFRIYKGRPGFIQFFDDVYETVKDVGGEVLVSNVDESSFTKWFGEYGIFHKQRMLNIIKSKKIYFKILIKEGDTNFAVPEYGEYRWVEKGRFQNVPFYVYGDKLAITLFSPDDVTIYMFSVKQITDAYRAQFEYIWDQAIKIPKQLIKPTLHVSDDSDD